jgi:hypothetical protein
VVSDVFLCTNIKTFPFTYVDEYIEQLVLLLASLRRSQFEQLVLLLVSLRRSQSPFFTPLVPYP